MNVLYINKSSTPYTYILEWTKYNKRYIGARWAANCSPDDLFKTYFTSSNYVAEFIEKYGNPDIVLIDKIFTNAKDAREREIELLTKFDIKNNDNFLNKAIGGLFDFNDNVIRKKMRNAQLGKKLTLVTKEKIGLASKNRIRKKETYEKLSKTLTGRKLSKEHCLSISLAKKGVTTKRIYLPLSNEQKQRLRTLMTGLKHSEETKLKMSDSRKNKKFPIVECPHCGKIGGKAAMHQWHFNNCKIKGV